MKHHVKKTMLTLLLTTASLLTACNTRSFDQTGTSSTTSNATNTQDYYVAGYGEAEIIPSDLNNTVYYIAGYKNNNPATGVLDYQKAKAVFIDDNSKEGGIFIIAVDCIGISRAEIQKMRKMIDIPCRSIQIISTHTHAGIDTLGLWGEIGVDGKNPDFSEKMYAAVVSAAKTAYENRLEGKLYTASTKISGLQRDSRDPQIYDDTLSCLRFAPNDGTSGFRIVNYAAHAEALRSENSKISADYPAYLSAEIKEKTGDDVLFIPGAIGGLIMTERLKDEKGNEYPVEENVVRTGKLIASYAIDAMKNERELAVSIGFVSETFSVKVENEAFCAYRFLGVITHKIDATEHMETEINYISFGNYEILTVPGELFPELAIGYDTFNKAANPDMENPTPLEEILKNPDLVIFGLANDEIGYIIPPNDYLVNAQTPYFVEAVDQHGRKHYEETNSLGKNTAYNIAEAAKRIAKKIGR